MYFWLEPGAVVGVFTVIKLFFVLAAGHAIGDFPLQGEFLAIWKNRHHHQPGMESGTNRNRMWFSILSAHSLIHGGIVYVITGWFWLGLVEFVLHWITDFVKCEGKLSFNMDQGLHYLVKLVYAFIVVYWPGWAL